MIDDNEKLRTIMHEDMYSYDDQPIDRTGNTTEIRLRKSLGTSGLLFVLELTSLKSSFEELYLSLRKSQKVTTSMLITSTITTSDDTQSQQPNQILLHSHNPPLPSSTFACSSILIKCFL